MSSKQINPKTNPERMLTSAIFSARAKFQLGLTRNTDFSGGREWVTFKYPSRSSRSQMWFKIGVLKIFAIFTGKYLCWSLFLIKLLNLLNFIKRRLQRRCFPVNIAKFLRTLFFRLSTVAASTAPSLVSSRCIKEIMENGINLGTANSGGNFINYKKAMSAL